MRLTKQEKEFLQEVLQRVNVLLQRKTEDKYNDDKRIMAGLLQKVGG